MELLRDNFNNMTIKFTPPSVNEEVLGGIPIGQ